MISSSVPKSFHRCLTFAFSVCAIFLFASSALAVGEDSFALTITPPLFQLTMSPGESWTSAIKVVNKNSYDIDIYANPVNFEVKGEKGTGRFIPLSATATTSYSLASWLTVPTEPIHIPAEKTGMIPFTLSVPENAEPGGHYGAILTGNRPVETAQGNVVKVSAAISSLFLLRVNGEMIEKGDIREFSLDRKFYQEPKVDFTLRFENKGNIHLLPRGEIAIYNMWGKERGKILINQDSDFGNVLPKSIRNFAFEWTGENNFFEVGRYTAVATLVFGDQEKETVYQEIYFWVIPLGPAIKIFVFLFAFIGIFVWSIRRYVRKALALEAERMAVMRGITSEEFLIHTDTKKESVVLKPMQEFVREREVSKAETFVRPITLGVVDLRNAISKTSPERKERNNNALTRTATLSKFIRKYKIFLLCLLLILCGVYGIRMYFSQVLTHKRAFDVKEQREDGGIPVGKNTAIKEGDITLEQ